MRRQKFLSETSASPLKGHITLVFYHKVKLFICTSRLINKDYRYLYEMCVETGLSRALALNSACVAKIA